MQIYTADCPEFGTSLMSAKPITAAVEWSAGDLYFSGWRSSNM